MVPNTDLYEIFALYQRGTQKELMNIPLPRLPIAYIELIAALVGISVFSKYQTNKLINLFSDNTDVVAWLRKLYKMKLCVDHIPGIQNNSADELSRGSVPTWLKLRGKRLDVDLHRLTNIIKKPLHFWQLGI